LMFTNMNQNKPILIVVVVVEPVTKSSKKQCLSVQAAAANHCRLQINNLSIAFKCSRNCPSNRFHPYKKSSSKQSSLVVTIYKSTIHSLLVDVHSYIALCIESSSEFLFMHQVLPLPRVARITQANPSSSCVIKPPKS
ncbi:hypothetical protein Csa_018352, partial [Cucumis sativus]